MLVVYGVCASRMRRDHYSIVHISTWSSLSLWHSIIVSPARVCMVEVGIAYISHAAEGEPVRNIFSHCRQVREDVYITVYITVEVGVARFSSDG